MRICRCLHQDSSWSNVQVDFDTMHKMFDDLNVSPNFWRTVSCFFQRLTNLEEGYCAPFTSIDSSEKVGELCLLCDTYHA